MKCPKCRRNMTRKNYGNIYYFECDHCGASIGKPQIVEQKVNTQEEEVEIQTADDDAEE